MNKNIRHGLRPLSVQIGMAMAEYAGHYAALKEGGDLPSENLPDDIQNMLLGIQKYQTHNYVRSDLPLDVVWQSGQIFIGGIQGHDYSGAGDVVLLVPSLINKSYIFDLNEERSMLRWLAAQGFHPYLLSWGEPMQDAGQATMEGIVLDRLVPALTFLSQHTAQNIHALGYCMGGTLLAAAAAHQGDALKSIILLAAPWDFHGGGQALLNRVQFWAPSAFPAIEEKGTLGVDWIQTVFASLDPAAAMRKFSRFLEMEGDSDQVRLFVAVEDWLNDGVDLPGAVAQHCIRDWFLGNVPARGGWYLDEQAVKPENITVPALVIASDKDRLVEYETASILADKIPNATLLNPSCGHIGVIAGRHSVAHVWEPLAQWIKAL